MQNAFFIIEKIKKCPALDYLVLFLNGNSLV